MDLTTTILFGMKYSKYQMFIVLIMSNVTSIVKLKCLEYLALSFSHY